MKLEKEYESEYGNISRDSSKRLSDFLSEHQINRLKRDVFSEMKRINLINWKSETFVIYLLPKATPRPRSTVNGSFFYVKGAKDNKVFFQRAIRDMDLPYIDTPCKFHCTSYLPIPKSMNSTDQILAEKGFIRPVSKPDFDNLVKTYSDMLQDVILDDDKLIIEGTSSKYYSWKPRIEITIEYMEDFDSEFNKKKIKKKGRKSYV